jgi:hypothetical protein
MVAVGSTKAMAGRKPIPEEERFWEKVDKSGLNPDYPECWDWIWHVFA